MFSSFSVWWWFGNRNIDLTTVFVVPNAYHTFCDTWLSGVLAPSGVKFGGSWIVCCYSRALCVPWQRPRFNYTFDTILNPFCIAGQSSNHRSMDYGGFVDISVYRQVDISICRYINISIDYEDMSVYRYVDNYMSIRRYTIFRYLDIWADF